MRVVTCFDYQAARALVEAKRGNERSQTHLVDSRKIDFWDRDDFWMSRFGHLECFDVCKLSFGASASLSSLSLSLPSRRKRVSNVLSWKERRGDAGVAESVTVE